MSGTNLPTTPALRALGHSLVFRGLFDVVGPDSWFLLADAGERDCAMQLLSVVPTTLDSIGPVTLVRADPTGSLARATQEALFTLGISSKNAVAAGTDFEAALCAALEAWRPRLRNYAAKM
jgi:hypothetical protein